MRNDPIFTIITASLNNASTIKQTLESIKNQTFQHFEHIVIDGGSEDKTVDILKAAETTYNLTWFSERDEGIADALNKGIQKSKGQYVIVIQADDRFWNPTILQRVYPLLDKQKIGIFCFPVILEHPAKGQVLRKPIRWLWWNHFKFIFPHQGCFVNQEVFRQIGGFRKEYKINMDYDFFYRALGEKVSVKFGEFPVVLMGGSGIGSDPNRMIARLKEERLVQRLNEKNPFWKLAQSFFSLFYMQYKLKSLPTRNS
jgi:glycosyltransferase involved in cell wall biosynthesis